MYNMGTWWPDFQKSSGRLDRNVGFWESRESLRASRESDTAATGPARSICIRLLARRVVRTSGAKTRDLVRSERVVRAQRTQTYIHTDGR